MPKGIRTPDLSLRESHGRVFYYPLKSSKILDFTGFFKIIVLIISLIKSANFMPYFSFILGQFTRNYTQTVKRGLLTTNKG